MIFFHGDLKNYNIYMHKKIGTILKNSFGLSGILVMKMSNISANLLSGFFLDLTLMSFWEHIKANMPKKNIFSVISY